MRLKEATPSQAELGPFRLSQLARSHKTSGANIGKGSTVRGEQDHAGSGADSSAATGRVHRLGEKYTVTIRYGDENPSLSATVTRQRRSPLNQAFLEPPENDGVAPRWSTAVTQIAIFETPVKGESIFPIEPHVQPGGSSMLARVPDLAVEPLKVAVRERRLEKMRRGHCISSR